MLYKVFTVIHDHEFADFGAQIIFVIIIIATNHQLSTTVGEGTAGLYLEADYGSERPFNTSLEVFADVGTQSFGLSSHSASDLQWQNFTGKSTVRLCFKI